MATKSPNMNKQPEVKIDYPSFAVAGLTAGHGVMEYMKAANPTALAVGLGFGAALAISGYRTTYDQNDSAANTLGLISSSALAAFKGKQFYDTQKTPYGIIAGAALLLAARYGAHYFGFTNGKK